MSHGSYLYAAIEQLFVAYENNVTAILYFPNPFLNQKPMIVQ